MRETCKPYNLRNKIIFICNDIFQPAIDHIIVFVHWGSEYMSIPNEEQREVAIQLRKLGINLIIGSHPHVKQGHEWINDTLVHYSLGNFLFHQLQ